MKKLKMLRRKIDSTDNSIVKSLSSRHKIILKIAKLKAIHNLPVIQKNRSHEIQRARALLGKKLGLRPSFVEKIFKMIQNESIIHQKEVVAKYKNSKKRRS